MVWRKVVEIVESIECGLGWWCRRRGGARFLRRGKIWECEGGDLRRARQRDDSKHGVHRTAGEWGSGIGLTYEELRIKRKDRTASREDGGDGGRRV